MKQKKKDEKKAPFDVGVVIANVWLANADLLSVVFLPSHVPGR